MVVFWQQIKIFIPVIVDTHGVSRLAMSILVKYLCTASLSIALLLQSHKLLLLLLLLYVKVAL